MTFDQCVEALIVIAKSGVSETEAIAQTEIVVSQYLVSCALSKVTERNRLATALGDSAPDPSLTLVPLMQNYLAGIASK
jgi:hypothetical protein